MSNLNPKHVPYLLDGNWQKSTYSRSVSRLHVAVCLALAMILLVAANAASAAEAVVPKEFQDIAPGKHFYLTPRAGTNDKPMYCRSTADSLRVRSSPEIKPDNILKDKAFKEGEMLEVTMVTKSRDTLDLWYLVKAGEISVYVFAKFCELKQ